MSVDFDVRYNRRCTFSLEEVLLWIMYWYFRQKQRFEVKHILIDVFLTNMQFFSSQDINWWTGVLWIIGLSFWRHPFTAEHPLWSKLCSIWSNLLDYSFKGLNEAHTRQSYMFLHQKSSAPGMCTYETAETVTSHKHHDNFKNIKNNKEIIMYVNFF